VSGETGIVGKVLIGPFGGARETTIAGRQGVPCRHYRYVINTESRTVKCGTCEAALDAFDVLKEYAAKERTFKHWEQQSLDAQRRLAALKDEERKVKARTRAASRKDAAQAVADERMRIGQRMGELQFRISSLRDLADELDRFMKPFGPGSARSPEARDDDG